MGQNYWYENTSVSLINYHFVWIVRRRKKILAGEMDVRVQELIRQAVKELEGEVIALETDLDHVHLFMQAKPVLSPAQIMHKIKGSVSHQIRIEFPWVKEKLPSLWTRSYFCGTTGNVSGDTVKRYVEEQKTK
jgi:putative transposase